MPTRPDIRDLATNVRDAFADADRETLLDVLTFVVKEYVVEGPPPMLIHQAENLTDLQGKTFAQLIAALQARLDHPELAMFVVDGDQVGVRIGGVVHPLLPGRTPGVPGSHQVAGGAANFIDTRPNAAPPAPAPGVRVVEANLAPRPPAPAAPQPAPTREAPPPNRGLSIRGQPSGAPTPPAAPAPAPAGQPPTAAAPQPGAPEKPEGSGDDASARFSLLELD
jgi:hypothetical protein